MQFFAFVALTLAPILLVATSPINLEKRLDTSSYCGHWDIVTTGDYKLLLDHWGASDATSGLQCAHITKISGTTIAWKTTFNWIGGTHIKSFTNIQLNAGINRQLSAIKTMPAIWDWSMSTTNDIVADVAFDLFTSNNPGGSNVNEVMIWLANFNAWPISAQYNSHGAPKAIATRISLGGHTWSLYSGSNGYNKVFSFLPTSGTIPRFNADILPFFTYLIRNQGVPSSQYLVTAQAGIEPTSGSATLTTSSYSISIG